MYGSADIATLFDLAGVHQLTNGGQLVIRAEYRDTTLQRPHGLSYAFILQDATGRRLLAFDNAHAYDGAGPDEPFDHEHPAGRVNTRIRYHFTTASALITDGFARCEAYCAAHGIPFEFVE